MTIAAFRRLGTCWILAALVAWPFAARTQSAEPHAHPHWGYSGPQGPDHWRELPEGATCGTGRHQSPIDIGDTVRAKLPAIEFRYAASALHVVDNGHTIMVTYAPGSAIIVDGQSYELQQFHFHEPSEERVHGHAFALVAHLVHKNAKGELAVVAVLFKQGRESAALAPILGHLPPGKETEIAPSGLSISAAELLPAARGYYTYTGSLTTPPCSENVTWFVLKTPVEASAAQLAAFAKRYPHNARPVQPLNDRVVREAED